MSNFEQDLPLGKTTTYRSTYDASLLCPVPRSLKRNELGLTGELPFTGEDIWNAYELSWLNSRGKPVVAIGEIRFDSGTANLVESKSLKLYLNSFNQTRFSGFELVRETIARDLAAAANGEVKVDLAPLGAAGLLPVTELPGRCIDDIDIPIDDYQLNPLHLSGAADPSRPVTETLHSHLLKSNCLVTSQPDWGSVMVHYCGPRIAPEALLRYLISYRQHNEFHEQCVERIFCDLQRHCRPEKLTVYARYTRRGGLDINPFRSNFESAPGNLRLVRQ